MMRRFAVMALIATGGVLIGTCGESEPSGARPANFVAEISGAIAGRVSGPGLIRYHAPSEANFGSIPGHYIIADDAGVRDFGITFTIPGDARPGTHELVSAHPLDVGTAFEARVDRSVGNRTESFEANTTGTIRLRALPEEGKSIEGQPVRGEFDFATQGKNGREIAVSGSFDFQGGEARP